MVEGEGENEGGVRVCVMDKLRVMMKIVVCKCMR